MLKELLPKNKRIIYLNDRHEERDTQQEDRRKLYDKRILPFLERDDYAIFGDKINPFLWEYYRGFGLAGIKEENIYYVDAYMNYPSLTKAAINDAHAVYKLRQLKAGLLVPYIESENTKILSDRIGTRLLRDAGFTDWINNKLNFRRIIRELDLPEISGFESNFHCAITDFLKLKASGFKKVVLKRPRSISGFGVFIVEKLSQLVECLADNFSFGDAIVIEGYIDNMICCPNFQYFIDEKSNKFLTATDQIMGDDRVSYCGNIFPSFLLKNPVVYANLLDFSEKICNYLRKNECYGIVGIDFIATKDGRVFATEANARFNGSTYPALLANKLLAEKSNQCWIFKTLNTGRVDTRKLFEENKLLIKPGGKTGIFPIGIDVLETLGEGQFMVIGNGFSEMEKILTSFEIEVKKNYALRN